MKFSHALSTLPSSDPTSSARVPSPSCLCSRLTNNDRFGRRLHKAPLASENPAIGQNTGTHLLDVPVTYPTSHTALSDQLTSPFLCHRHYIYQSSWTSTRSRGFYELIYEILRETSISKTDRLLCRWGGRSISFDRFCRVVGLWSALGVWSAGVLCVLFCRPFGDSRYVRILPWKTEHSFHSKYSPQVPHCCITGHQRRVSLSQSGKVSALVPFTATLSGTRAWSLCVPSLAISGHRGK